MVEDILLKHSVRATAHKKLKLKRVDIVNEKLTAIKLCNRSISIVFAMPLADSTVSFAA